MNKSQVDSSLACENCQISFDLETRIPKLLPCCRHTICSKCLQKLHPSIDRKCPLCREILDKSLRIASNDEIMDRIKATKWEKCPEHGNDIQFYCEFENIKICSDCLYHKNPDCQEHDRSHLETLRPRAENGKRIYEDMLDGLENNYTRLEGELVENRRSMEKMICGHFDKNISQLERNKLRALRFFNKACNEEKREFEMSFGEESDLRNDLRAIISDHINFRKISDPIGVLGDQYRPLHDKVNSLTHNNNNVPSFQDQLANISQSLQRQLRKQEIANEKNWEEFMTHIVDEMKTKGLPQFNGTKDHQSVKKPQLKITSNLEFTLRDGILSIVEGYKMEREFSFLKEKLRQVSEITFAFQTLDIKDEDWEVISRLLHKVFANKESSLKLCLRCDNNGHSPVQLSRLFTVFFQNPTKITSLKASLYLNKDSMFLLSLVLLQLSNLESLALTFRREVFPIECFENLIQGLNYLAPRLESLYLHFSKNQIEALRLQEIFIAMPILKKFDLDVSEIPSLNEEIFAPLERNYHQLMPQLKEFIIDVSGTKVDPSYGIILKHTFKRIPKVDVRNRQKLNENNERNGSLERSEVQQIV